MRDDAEEKAETFTVLPAGNTSALAHPGTNAIHYWIHPASRSFWLIGEYSSPLGHTLYRVGPSRNSSFMRNAPALAHPGTNAIPYWIQPGAGWICIAYELRHDCPVSLPLPSCKPCGPIHGCNSSDSLHKTVSTALLHAYCLALLAMFSPISPPIISALPFHPLCQY